MLHSQTGASMNKEEWKAIILKSTDEAGTYRKCFDSVIDTLAGIMEMRDDALERFYDYGGNTVIEYTNKAGNTNVVKNPALVVVDDLNKTALAYWRDLGLTPAGLKRVKDLNPSDDGKKSALEVALEELTRD